MKPLQNNFTTPEQSKILLELGIPADSADGVYIIYNEGTDDEISQLTIPNDTQCKPCEMVEKGNENYKNGNVSFCLSWSVGRLIELIRFCTEGIDIYLYDSERPNMVMCLVKCIEKNINKFDFSKLNK